MPAPVLLDEGLLLSDLVRKLLRQFIEFNCGKHFSIGRPHVTPLVIAGFLAKSNQVNVVQRQRIREDMRVDRRLSKLHDNLQIIIQRDLRTEHTVHHFYQFRIRLSRRKAPDQFDHEVFVVHVVDQTHDEQCLGFIDSVREPGFLHPLIDFTIRRIQLRIVFFLLICQSILDILFIDLDVSSSKNADDCGHRHQESYQYGEDYNRHLLQDLRITQQRHCNLLQRCTYCCTHSKSLLPSSAASRTEEIRLVRRCFYLQQIPLVTTPVETCSSFWILDKFIL